ncbi:uncharacterized protein EV154DRAFT_487543 [Mucor mucedo]|uniref:uncharacterized protein n=1 Tax=Mucor mucedo TaxID=29922 RepID=UPI00221FB1B5|nr:uncharacterized protein EV154DRAFT_487543 [Mucor mucedo]KAI7872253.1 hypothetical protein EV154DRAFT_487543 [Mucor mucedo]
MHLSMNVLLKITISLLLFSQITQAFCVYNKLEGDRVRMLVTGPFTSAPPDRKFSKEIDQGESECCPYDNKDCVSGGQRHAPVFLYFKFAFDLLEMWEVKRQYNVVCEGGAGIVLTGSNYSNIECTCFKSNGEVVRSKLQHWALV